MSNRLIRYPVTQDRRKADTIKQPTPHTPTVTTAPVSDPSFFLRPRDSGPTHPAGGWVVGNPHPGGSLTRIRTSGKARDPMNLIMKKCNTKNQTSRQAMEEIEFCPPQNYDKFRVWSWSVPPPSDPQAGDDAASSVACEAHRRRTVYNSSSLYKNILFIHMTLPSKACKQ